MMKRSKNWLLNVVTWFAKKKKKKVVTWFDVNKLHNPKLNEKRLHGF